MAVCSALPRSVSGQAASSPSRQGWWRSHAAAWSAALCGILPACSPEGIVGVSTEVPADIALYQTYELAVRGRSDGPNPFTQFVEATFRIDDQEVFVEGFYDGDDTWRIRFSPETPGEWHYVWRLGRRRGSGVLHVGKEPWLSRPQGPEGRVFRHRGHVRASGDNRIRLVHGDGSPHYWVGAKWLSAKNYGPPKKGGEVNEREENGSLHDSYYSDDTFYEFLDTTANLGLNGMLLKLGLYPVEDDGLTWDLDWIRRADLWVAAMNERGVYCQITLFEPWSRRLGSPFEYSLDSSEHVLDAWAPGQEAEKENYIRYALARFSGYANVYWELANRVRHPGFDDRTFLEQASEHYTAWLQHYDPYRVAVALSDVEQARALPGINVEVPRSSTHLPAPPEARKARVVNELVHDCGPVGTGARGYLDATIRDPEHRLCYRSAGWIAFTSGAFGSAAASWLDLSRPLNTPTRSALEDLGRMKGLLDDLPRFDLMLPDTRHVHGGTGHLGTRSRPGYLYVSYFRGPAPAGQVTVELLEGLYDERWLDPATGHVLLEETRQVRRTGDRTFAVLDRPAINEDAVLVLHNRMAVVVR